MDEAVWVAALHEVKRQAQRLAEQAKVVRSDEDGVWYDVSEGMDRVSLAAAPVGEEGAWRQQQWHNAFEVLFFHTPPQVSGGGQDDLLFFEYMAAHQTSDNPLFVRRKGRALPADLALGGEKAGQVNWCRSTLLNLVLQTTFTLTVAACARASLQLPVLAGEGPAPVDMTRVSKHVFASPTRVTVNLDSSRSGEEQPTSTYPDLCFAVDNFDDAFKSLVLSEPGWCYVVLLVASEGLPLNAWFQRECQQRFQQAEPAQPADRLSRDVPDAAALAGACLREADPAGPSAAESRQAGVGADHPGHDWLSSQAAHHARPTASEEPPVVDLPDSILAAVAPAAANAKNPAEDEGPCGSSSSRSASAAELSSRGAWVPAAGDSATQHAREGADVASSSPDSSARHHSRHNSQADSLTASVSTISLANEPIEGELPSNAQQTQPEPTLLGPSYPNAGERLASGAEASTSEAAVPADKLRSASGGSNGGEPDSSRLVLFSGFVSYEQLEDAMLGKRGGGRRKPPSGANRVRMKGPGGQGHADVAVTCLAPKDEGHLRPDALPATPAVQPPVRAQAAGRGGLLGRTMQIASKAVVSTAKGIAGALLDEPRGGLVVQYYMRCALMSLSLPVDLLAAQILKLT